MDPGEKTDVSRPLSCQWPIPGPAGTPPSGLCRPPAAAMLRLGVGGGGGVRRRGRESAGGGEGGCVGDVW